MRASLIPMGPSIVSTRAAGAAAKVSPAGGTEGSGVVGAEAVPAPAPDDAAGTGAGSAVRSVHAGSRLTRGTRTRN
mgnify:CR=1 FL=1